MSVLALLLAFAPPPTPMTVNSEALGKPEEFRTAGPARVCMRELAIDAKVGEAVYLGYAGIHSGTLTLVVADKSIDFEHGEIWAFPKRKGKLVSTIDKIRLYRTRREGKLAYLVTVPEEDYRGRMTERARIWIHGDLLNGTKADLDALSRMTVGSVPATDCNQTYSYGWSMLFGEEPLSTKKDQ